MNSIYKNGKAAAGVWNTNVRTGRW